MFKHVIAPLGEGTLDTTGETGDRWWERNAALFKYFDYVVHFFLAAAGGTLVFLVNLLRDRSVTLIPAAKQWFLVSAGVLVTSVVLGGICVGLRGLFYRDSTVHHKEPMCSAKRIRTGRDSLAYAQWSSILARCQVGLFFIGFAALVILMCVNCRDAFFQ